MEQSVQACVAWRAGAGAACLPSPSRGEQGQAWLVSTALSLGELGQARLVPPPPALSLGELGQAQLVPQPQGCGSLFLCSPSQGPVSVL